MPYHFSTTLTRFLQLVVHFFVCTIPHCYLVHTIRYVYLPSTCLLLLCGNRWEVVRYGYAFTFAACAHGRIPSFIHSLPAMLHAGHALLHCLPSGLVKLLVLSTWTGRQVQRHQPPYMVLAAPSCPLRLRWHSTMPDVRWPSCTTNALPGLLTLLLLPFYRITRLPSAAPGLYPNDSISYRLCLDVYHAVDFVQRTVTCVNA